MSHIGSEHGHAEEREHAHEHDPGSACHVHSHAPGGDHSHGPHSHGHHSHGLGHAHAPADFGRAFAIGIGLNALFVCCEVAAGLWGNSVALLADAGHNLSDVLGLVVAWLATILAKRAPTSRFTYGLGASSILAALFNAVFLLVVIGGLSWEAIERLSSPQPVAGKTVMIVAGLGILINGGCALMFASGHKDDINIRGAFLHMAADALVSAGVVVAGLVILLTGWAWLDPAVSLLVNAIIVWGTWSLLRDSMAMSLNAVPRGIEAEDVRAFLSSRPGVAAVHDLHIWGMSTTQTALTAHLVMDGDQPAPDFLSATSAGLRTKFGIGHPTLQLETADGPPCPLAPAHIV